MTTEAPTIVDVKLATIEALKGSRTSAVQKVVMDHGGRALDGAPSLKALPRERYAACIAAIKALPRTK